MATDGKSSNPVKGKTRIGDGPSSASSKPKIAVSSSSSKKVVASSIKQSADVTHRSTATVSKVTRKTSSKTKVVTKTVTKTREKKVYSLPGQKFDVPEEREPLRIFYESLSKQIPSSEMAEFWMMEHGLLSPERAKKAFEKKQKIQKQIRMGTPIKSPPSRASGPAESSKRAQLAPPKGEIKAKKRIMNDSDDVEDEFVLSHKRRKG